MCADEETSVRTKREPFDNCNLLAAGQAGREHPSVGIPRSNGAILGPGDDDAAVRAESGDRRRVAVTEGCEALSVHRPNNRVLRPGDDDLPVGEVREAGQVVDVTVVLRRSD